MYKNPKLTIYQGMIQFLLDSTGYNLKRIAHLTNSSIKCIRAIYSYNEIPNDFKSELYLIRLYQIILESEKKYGTYKQVFPQRYQTKIISQPSFTHTLGNKY